MLEGQALLDAIAAQPFEKVTKEGMESRIVSTEYVRLGETVTICSITLNNGYSVRGESACVDPRNYNEEIGNSLAYNQAFNKIWALEGYLLAERRMQDALAGLVKQENVQSSPSETSWFDSGSPF